MSGEILEVQRIATASIRGYYYQFAATVEQWIALGPDESLLCEGNEDIDKWMGDSVEHQSIKHLAGTLTENDASVRETIANFAREFVFQRRRGKSASFVFRTTATLRAPTEHPVLTAWLQGDDVNAPAVRRRLLACAEGKQRHNTLVALRYLSMHGLFGDFFAAVTWNWGELDYEGVRVALIARTRRDARFAGLSPTDVVDKLVAQVIRVSSSQRGALDERRLTAFQLEQIAVELSLKKHVVEFRASRGEPSRALYVAWERCGGVDTFLVGRFASEEEANGILSSLRAHRQNQPGANRHQMLFAAPTERDVLEAIGGLDVDFYATFGAARVEQGDQPDWARLVELITIATSKFDAKRLYVDVRLNVAALGRVCEVVGISIAICDSDDDCGAVTRWTPRANVT